MKILKVNNHLGMYMNLSKDLSVKVSMIKYVKKTMDTFPEAIKYTYNSPAADHIFQIRE